MREYWIKIVQTVKEISSTSLRFRKVIQSLGEIRQGRGSLSEPVVHRCERKKAHRNYRQKAEIVKSDPLASSRY